MTLQHLDNTELPLGWTTRAKITKIVDGDTVDVELIYSLRIRLIDCWASELRSLNEDDKKLGQEAKKYLESVLPVGSEIVLHIPESKNHNIRTVFSFGRVLAFIYKAGQNISELMIKAGFAQREKNGYIN